MSIDDTPAPLRIVIIGAGIAGLSAAIALSKQGHHVTVRDSFAFIDALRTLKIKKKRSI